MNGRRKWIRFGKEMTPHFCNVSMRHTSLCDSQVKMGMLAQERDQGLHHRLCFHRHINSSRRHQISWDFSWESAESIRRNWAQLWWYKTLTHDQQKGISQSRWSRGDWRGRRQPGKMPRDEIALRKLERLREINDDLSESDFCGMVEIEPDCSLLITVGKWMHEDTGCWQFLGSLITEMKVKT